MECTPGCSLATMTHSTNYCAERDGSGARRIKFSRACRHGGVAGALAVSVLLLAGCVVAPNYRTPAPSKKPAYLRFAPAQCLNPGMDEPAQCLVRGKTIPRFWWRLFHSKPLDRIVRMALSGSPTLVAARERLAAAEEAIRAASGGYYPQLDAFAYAEREKGPAFATGLLHPRNVPTYDLYSVGPTVSFVPDVFGLTTRQVQEQSALAVQQADEVEAAQLAVTGNVVTQVFTLALLRAQLVAINVVVADDEKILALVRQRYALGKVDGTAVALAQAKLARDQVPVPLLKQRISTSTDALTVLVGRSPGEWQPPRITLDALTLPSELPLSLPSALVRQRPDIQAAQAELHAAGAAVGVATARLYPTFTLSATLAPTALTPAALFDGPNLVWNLLSGITEPLFHGGTLHAKKRAAIDQFHVALAVYRQTLLEAFRQVANTLQALAHDSEYARNERRALVATHQAWVLERIRYAAGKVNLLQPLEIQRRYELSRVSYVQARAARYLDSAELLVALGGGFQGKTVR